MRTSGVILSAIILLSGLAAHASALRTEGTAIVPVSAQASSTQTASKAVENLINGNGLSETAPGSRAWVHTASAFRDRGVERGTMWSSGSAGGQVERTPTLTFDLGRELALGGFRIWNYNETHWTGMGFKEVEVSASLDGRTFTPLGTAIFRQAPGEGDYEGQFVSFKSPIQARYVRLHCLSNWQGYDRAGLAEIRFHAGGAGAKDAIAPGVKPVAVRGVEKNIPNPPRPAIAGAENINFIDNPTKRTLVLRELGDVDDTSDQHPNGRGTIISGPGELFVEAAGALRPHQVRPDRRHHDDAQLSPGLRGRIGRAQAAADERTALPDSELPGVPVGQRRRVPRLRGPQRG